MTFDCGLCETNWVFGRSGECDFNSSVCLCPEGFSGMDDWYETQSCHVNEDLALGIHTFAVVMEIVGLLVSTTCCRILYKRWKGAQLKPRTDKTYVVSTATHSRSNALSRSQHVRSLVTRQIESRFLNLKKESMLICLFFAIFNISALCYNAPFLVRSFTEKDEYEIISRRFSMSKAFPWHPLALVGLTLACEIVIFLLLWTFYRTLPSVTQYGNLLGINGYFVRYPNFIFRLSTVAMTIAVIYPFVIFIIVPAIVGTDIYPTIVYFYTGKWVISLVLFEIFKPIVINSVRSIFRKGIKSIENDEALIQQSSEERVDQKQRLQYAITVSWYFQVGTSFLTYSGIASEIFWIATQGLFQYVILNITIILVSLGSIAIPMGMVFKTV